MLMFLFWHVSMMQIILIVTGVCFLPILGEVKSKCFQEPDVFGCNYGFVCEVGVVFGVLPAMFLIRRMTAIFRFTFVLEHSFD